LGTAFVIKKEKIEIFGIYTQADLLIKKRGENLQPAHRLTA
jgi:hypothetical protein